MLVERTRPEYRSESDEHRDVPMTPEIAERFRMLRDADGAVRFGPGADHALSARAEEFGVRSMMVMAVYPHADQPYAFGVQQCSRARTWTPEEERLLQEIGRRLADGLTSRFVLRSLRESEGRLAEAQRVAHVGHWERDLTGGQVTVSPELLRIFDLGPDYPRDVSGWEAQWQSLVHPDDHEHAAGALADALHGGPRYDVEYRVVRADGQERVVHSQGDAIEPEPGRPRRMFGTVQDITEFRRAQDELRASESRFRVFVDHATDAFFLHGRRGVVLDVNQQACDSLGYTRDELVGMSPEEIDLDTDLVNISLWETIPRSLATTFITLLPILSLTDLRRRHAQGLRLRIVDRHRLRRLLVDLRRRAAALVDQGAGAGVRAAQARGRDGGRIRRRRPRRGRSAPPLAAPLSRRPRTGTGTLRSVGWTGTAPPAAHEPRPRPQQIGVCHHTPAGNPLASATASVMEEHMHEENGAGTAPRSLEQLLLAGIGWVSVGAEAVDQLADEIAKRVGVNRAEMRKAVRDTISSWRHDIDRVGNLRSEVGDRALQRARARPPRGSGRSHASHRAARASHASARAARRAACRLTAASPRRRHIPATLNR